MCIAPKIYRKIIRTLTVFGLCIISLKSYSQLRAIGDTVISIPSGSFIQIKDSISYFSTDTVLWVPSGADPYMIFENERNRGFYDSLKIKASRKPLTKKLYDFVIVAPDRSAPPAIEKRSDENYLNYAGKKIRNIEVRRLDVFGTNINNPGSESTHKVDNLLNKTHINTHENIIRKNLLFKSGDEIIPLTLGDNERLLRQLSFINDARILVVTVSDEEADIVVITRDIYSLGASYDYKGFDKGNLSIFEKNIFGLGHHLEIDLPFDFEKSNYPGFGATYLINNISRSFINLRTFYVNGLGIENYGFNISRSLVSTSTKYAGGISVSLMYTTEDFDTMAVAQPLSYNLQDYWISRSFLLSSETAKRIIIGARYYNNNVFEHPAIFEDSYHSFQKYKVFLGSFAFSHQKYYKTNLLYSYGRTEDIPYGALLRFTGGREFNEFKTRTYLGTDFSFGKSFRKIGYIYTNIAVGGYLLDDSREQEILNIKFSYFSNLITAGRSKIRNFIKADYTRGSERYSDEHLRFLKENGFSGFRNDSVLGKQRFTFGIETVLFSPSNLFGFQFSYFGFADLGYLASPSIILNDGFTLSSLGLGVRIRNDNLLFNTFQLRIAFYPSNPMPEYSRINNFIVTGEQKRILSNFDPGPPSVIPYR